MKKKLFAVVEYHDMIVPACVLFLLSLLVIIGTAFASIEVLQTVNIVFAMILFLVGVFLFTSKAEKLIPVKEVEE